MIKKFGLILFFSILLSNIFASSIPEKKVTVSLKNVKIEILLEAIQKQANIHILYNAKLFDNIENVSIVAEKEPWDLLLKKVLPHLGYCYEVKDDVVVIRRIKTNNDKFVKGVVKDDLNSPLVGATITAKYQKGDIFRTITDVNGKFNVPLRGNECIIIVSYVGFKSQMKRAIGNKKEVFIQLKPDTQMLDECVVTGYNTIDKRKLTSSITSISSKDLTLKGALTVDKMLDGKIPGLLSLSTSATPGASSKMRLRGSSTFTGSREPLWVIDGIIYENPVPLSADQINSWDNINLIGNAISGLNPNDIERIDVLKDASATAIYGTRAANGVIVITTKTGQVGKTNINYNFNLQVQSAPSYDDYELMTSKQRIDVSREIIDKGLYFQTTPERYGYEGALMDYWDKNISFNQFQSTVSKMESTNTDWFKELYKTSLSQSHNVSMSGGANGTRYYFSLGYNDDAGSERGTDLKRITTRMNLSTHLKDNIMLDVRLNGSVQEADYNSSLYSVFNEAYYTNRIFPARNEDGSLNYVQKFINTNQTLQKKVYGKYNILNELDNSGNSVKNKSINLTSTLNWEIIPQLRYSLMLGLTSTTNLTEDWINDNTFYASRLRGYDLDDGPLLSDSNSLSTLPDGGVWSNSSTSQNSYIIRNQLNYNFTLNKKHQFNFDLGQEASSVNYRGQNSGQIPGYMRSQGESFVPIWLKSAELCGENFEYLRYWFSGKGDVKPISFPTIIDKTDNKMSYYLTSTYSYARYFSLNFNIRNDGSNRFGQYESEKFNPVWSLSGRVNLHEFGPFDNDKIDMLSIRTSYGYRGNTPSACPYLIISTPVKDTTLGENVAGILTYPNSNLKWEKVSTMNFGLDFSLFKGRFTGAVDAYYNHSSDLISTRSTSLVNGTPSMFYNDGTAVNKGVELSLSTVNVQTKDFKWRTSLTYSTNKNIVKQGSQSNNTYIDYLTGTAVLGGHSIDGFYSYQFDGLDENGLPRFKGLTGNESGLSRNEILSKVMKYSGSRTPTSYGTFSTELSWKNFNMRAEFNYKLGYKVRMLRLYQDNNPALPLPEDNMNKAFVNRWRKPGDEKYTNVPGLTNVSLNAPDPKSYEAITDVNKYLYTMMDKEYIYDLGPTTYTGWFMYDYSDARVASGNHISFRSLTLGYDVPASFLNKLKIGSLRFDVQLQNLGLWVFDKKLKGQDPDQISSITIPELPSCNFSMNLSF